MNIVLLGATGMINGVALSSRGRLFGLDLVFTVSRGWLLFKVTGGRRSLLLLGILPLQRASARLLSI